MSEQRFEVGDMVIRRTTLECLRMTARVRARAIARVPPPGIVLERLTQECYGGKQVHYLVQWEEHVGDAGQFHREQMVVTMLAPYSEVESVCDEWQEAIRAIFEEEIGKE